MNDRWTDRLSEYVDGELGVAAAAALEAHLPSCGDCRATLEELRRVVTRAGKLDDRPPAADLWPEVATRIGLSPVAQRRSGLDPTTVRVIEKNLGIIDRAIRDAQSALAVDPANAYLNQHLAQAMRRKLELLRQAATLAGARS